MTLDLYTSSKLAVANWTGESHTPCITFERSGTGNSHFVVTQDVISFGQSGGGRPVEGVSTFGGKRIKVESPQEDFELSFDIAFTTSRYAAMFLGTTAYAVGTELTATVSQDRFRITMTWQDPEATSQTSAEKMRVVYKDCVMTSFEQKHDGSEFLRGTINFKITPFDSSGNSNIFIEYETSSDFTTLSSTHGGAEDSYVYEG